MNDYLLAIVLLVVAVAGVVVRKTYYYVPTKELKRRAERHDPLAMKLYPAVAYGESLRGLLWAWIGLTTAGGFVLLVEVAPAWLGFLAVIALLWVVNSWLPASRVTSIGVHLATLATPPIVWLLNHLHRPLSRGASVVQQRYTAPAHTGLFEREDLQELIERQQHQTDNRLSEEELEIARRALTFGEHRVRDIMIPRKQVKMALAGDTVGPVLIDELHKNGQGYLLVRESAQGDFVGILAFKKLSLRSNGQVKNLMEKEVYYVHENDRLDQALHAFFKTNCPLFVVVDSTEEYVGVITIDNLLRQLMGHIPGEDFESYHDVTAVAARHSKQEQIADKTPEGGKRDKTPADTPVKTDDKVVK